jgi:hypothetical protein
MYVDNSTGTISCHLTLVAEHGWANLQVPEPTRGQAPQPMCFFWVAPRRLQQPPNAAGIYLAETPSLPKGKSVGSNTGCLASSTEWNWLVNPKGTETILANTSLGALCFTQDTIASLLDEAGFTWKYFAVAGVATNPRWLDLECNERNSGKSVGPTRPIHNAPVLNGLRMWI